MPVGRDTADLGMTDQVGQAGFGLDDTHSKDRPRQRDLVRRARKTPTLPSVGDMPPEPAGGTHTAPYVRLDQAAPHTLCPYLAAASAEAYTVSGAASAYSQPRREMLAEATPGAVPLAAGKEQAGRCVARPGDR
jgi:hypothetical protein